MNVPGGADFSRPDWNIDPVSGLTILTDAQQDYCNSAYYDLITHLPKELFPERLTAGKEPAFATRTLSLTLRQSLSGSLLPNLFVEGVFASLDDYYQRFPPSMRGERTTQSRVRYQDRLLAFTREAAADQPAIMTVYGLRRAFRERSQKHACRAAFAILTAYGHQLSGEK